MTYQSNTNALVAYKKQAGKGTQATGAGGTVLRSAGGSGINFSKKSTPSKNIRRDGMQTRGRHGSYDVTGAWDHELTLDGLIDIAEAVVRDTWDVAALVLTEAQFTSLAIASNVVTFGGGNPATLGLRVGDIIRFTLLSQAADNSKNVRIVSMTPTTITVAAVDGVALTDMGADTACTITRPRKLIQFAGGSLIKRYFTIDEYDVDIDQSEVATDFVFGNFKIGFQPDGTVIASVGGVGTGQFQALSTAASPLLTNPTEATSLGLAVVDATLRIGGVDRVDLSSFELSADIQLSAPTTFGSGGQKYAPDVFSGQLQASITFTALRQDLQFIQDLQAETQYEFHIVMVDTAVEPKGFLSIYVGNATLGSVVKSALSQAGGGRTVTVTVPAALIGQDTRGAGYDATMIKLQTSL
jgi:hypothetical protein